MFYKSERTKHLTVDYSSPDLPNFDKYVSGTPNEKEAFLAEFKKRDLFTTVQELFKRITSEELVEYCTDGIYLKGELLLKWISSPECTRFTILEKQAMLGFTAIIANESFSKFVPGSQTTNLATCSAVPPILSCFKHLRVKSIDFYEDGDNKLIPMSYEFWQETNPKVLPYIMGRGLGNAIQNKQTMSDATDELDLIIAELGEEQVVKLLEPSPNRVFYPKNFPSNSLPKGMKIDAYNSLNYFERCMILGMWLFKHKHPDMILNPFEWAENTHYYIEPSSIHTVPAGLDASWMQLFNRVKTIEGEDVTV
jgi:hypothetical protein